MERVSTTTVALELDVLRRELARVRSRSCRPSLSAEERSEADLRVQVLASILSVPTRIRSASVAKEITPTNGAQMILFWAALEEACGCLTRRVPFRDVRAIRDFHEEYVELLRQCLA